MLADLVLRFGRVDRITYHPDGKRLETDTDHTVMLGVIACAFAARELPHLDRGLIAQYALVHDLVEAYAGDTPTLQIDEAGRVSKAAREVGAMRRIGNQFNDTLPWVHDRLTAYEARVTPEARYVKAMDKLLPKLTHILNGCVTIHAQGMSRDQLVARYEEQRGELLAYASDFPELMDLRDALIKTVLSLMPS